MVERWDALYVDGEWREPESGEYAPVEDPATGAHFAEAPVGTAADVDAAIRAAKRAYDREWRNWNADDRASVLRELSVVLADHREEIVRLETRENGKPLGESESDVDSAIASLEYYAGAANKHYGNTLPTHDGVMRMTLYEPYGVVGTIIPWNWPPMHVVDFLAPILAAGNTMVLKPAPETPLCALRIAELFDGVLPDGVFNVVTGGTEPGVALTGHPDVGKLAFTGNSETGKKVMAAAAENVTPTMLELGGKNANIYFEDAALDRAIPAVVSSCFYNAGEACSSSERLLVQESIHDAFVERFVEGTSELVVGHGEDPKTDLGPLSSRKQYEKVREYIEIGQAEGATLAYRGETPDDPDLDGGYYVAPHVFTGVTEEMRLFQEEVFGPVIAISSFETEKEAVDLSNSVKYGLNGAVWTDDARRAMRVTNRLEVGRVFVNTNSRGGKGAPMGGYKQSGIGRKHAFRETLREFTRLKTVRYGTGSDVRTM